VALHREAWRGREIDPKNLTETYESYMVAAMRRMIARRLGEIGEYRRDGEVIISHFLVFGRNFIGAYILGATQEAMKRYQVSTLEIWSLLSKALGRNYDYIDMLRGEELYKMRWNDRLIHNHRMILSRRLLPWSLYTGYQVLRSKYPNGIPWKVESAMRQLRKH
jgi:hypothetical protein